MIIILSVIIVLLLIYKYAWPRNKYWENRGLAAYKIKMFLSMKNVLHEIGEVYKKMKVEGQPVAGLYLTWEKLLFFSDLQLLQNVTTIVNKLFQEKRTNAELFDVILNPVNNFILNMKEVSTSDNEIDIGDLTRQLTTDIITSLALGADFNTLTKLGSKICEVTLRANEFNLRTVMKQLLIDWVPGVAKRLGIRARDPTANKFFIKCVQDAMEYRKQSVALHHDFLQCLLDAENADGEKMQMDLEEIAEYVMSLFVAGVEAPAVTMGYSLVEIKRNSQVESKLRAELGTVFEKHNYILKCEALDEMIYLDAVIKETLRMYPPVPMVKKKCAETFSILSNTQIDKGTSLAVSIFAVQRDPEYYTEPEVFNPERSPTNTSIQLEQIICTLLEESKEHLERKLLLLICKITLALILWNFDYEISENIKYPLNIDSPNGVLVPKDTICLKLSSLITSL